ncbi:MAG: methylmalonyl-CoA mutase family protein [Dehalococcoidia bacterium]|nr:methylmalonyl-CoA mutase family protein [Dehalococcoidia bacterium]
MFDKEKLAEIKAARDAWEKENVKEFSKERKKDFACESEISIKRVYTPLDLAEKGFDYMKDLGLPGDFPYTRGISPTMYRSRLWPTGRVVGYATPEESNKLGRSQVAAGALNLLVQFDLPTQMGYDPDDPMSEGEVGRVGVSLSSLRDWEIAFEGIDLEKINTSPVLNAVGAVGIATHLVLGENNGISLQKVRGSCQNDALKSYIARGDYIFPPGHAFRLIIDTLSFCAKNAPNYKPLEISGLQMSEAGANPVHEAAICLANVTTYLNAVVERGLDIDAIAPGINVVLSAEHHGFFQEIAKFRATRRIYARLLRDKFGARNPRSITCRLSVGQGGTSGYREQYLNNIARSSIACLSAMLGGAQVCYPTAYDEQFGIPTEEASTYAIRCQQVVANETGVADVVDPLGGSYFIESLTSEFEDRITAELEKVERLGGSLKCIESGYFRRQIAQDAYKWHKAFEAGEVLRVGVNCFRSEEETRPLRIYRADPQNEAKRKEAVEKIRQTRNNGKVQKSLLELKKAAACEPDEEHNLMPYIMDVVRSYATMGEIRAALQEVWGEYKESNVF